MQWKIIIVVYNESSRGFIVILGRNWENFWTFWRREALIIWCTIENNSSDSASH